MIVADPSFAPMYATRRRRVKTDRRDARTLAEACRLGAFRRAHRLSEGQRHVHAELAVRDVLVRTRSRYVGLIKALVRRDGLRVASSEPTPPIGGWRAGRPPIQSPPGWPPRRAWGR